MGDSEKYYYLKPKSVPNRVAYGVSPAKSRPVIKPAVGTLRGIVLGDGGQVMNMDFQDTAAASSDTLSLGWFVRAFLVVLLATVLYIGGGLIYQGAENIKDNITDVAARGVDKLETAALALTVQDINTAKTNFVAAENLFARAQKDILSLGQTNLYLSNLANADSRIVTGQKLVDSGINLARAGEIFVDTMVPLVQYLDGVSGQQVDVQDFAIRISALLESSIPDIDRALTRVNKANQLLSSVQPQLIDPVYQEAIANAQVKTATLQSLITMSYTLAQELPDVLGMNNPRSYLILNQNDAELRPTGGFMGSVTLVELYRGEVVDMFVDDSYRIDGQIVGPYSTEKVFPNANFEPDFVAAAHHIEKLYEEGGGGSVDGVIAINTQVMSSLLSVIGDIYLPERDVTITPARFAQIIHEEIDKEWETAAPKQILSELLPVVVERLTTLDQVQRNQIGATLLAQLKSKNLLLKSNNRKLQPMFEKINWSGQLFNATDQQDFLMIARANMGARKSSHSIVEEIDHTVGVNLSGEVQTTLQLTYTHTGTGEYPDGSNQEFVRVYVPNGSTLQSISGIDEGTQVTTETAYGKTVFAFWVTTEPGGNRQVAINYQLPFTLDTNEGLYSIYFQKQPGANSTVLNSTLKLSPALQIANEDGLKTKRLFDGKFAQDQLLGVDFIQVT